MKTWILIVIALLALATVIIWTFATATLYRRGRCRVYPYYWCDTKWACCNKANDNENCEAAGGTKTAGSYKITDKFYGTNDGGTSLGDDGHNQYYDLCIAPANAIIATYPGVASLNCLYDSTVACPGTSTSTDFNKVPGYNSGSYDPSTCPSNDPTSSCNGLQGRCYYYSIDDSPASTETYNPNPSISYSYLPGYLSGTNPLGNNSGYLLQPKLNPNSVNPYQSGYYFAGNSSPGQTPTNGFANGPNQADSTNYSAWNRLGNIKASPP